MKDVKRSIKRLVRYADESEKSIEAYLVRKTKAMGGLCLKFSSHSETGYPDRLLMMPGGETAWAEIKSKGCKPRAIQYLRMAELEHLGFRTYVLDSREKVDEMLKELNDAIQAIQLSEDRL